ncbi:uncharacterized protein LOC131685782 isoform X1 [Topomyia yanbarensis]|uniref:uncharacterized protein LOC131685782 isoform X1 n=1 Tax=Topomyia yanbarensis TaxID=2498891 RepID=UPI00273C7B26|nr:uncharacterized protein LOC131685782 isoform X1 [Topomyia yanbarensis]
MSCCQTLLFKYFFNGYIFLLRCFCLLSFKFNTSHRAFYYSNISFVYTIIFILAYAYILPQYLEVVFRLVTGTSPQITKLLTGFWLSTIYLGGIVPCLVGLVYRKSILNLYNSYVRLWYTLKQGVPENFDRKIFYRFIFKSVVIDGVCIVGAVGIRVRFYWLNGRTPYQLYDALFNYFILSMHACVSNLFVIVAYLGAHYFRILNYRIQMVNGMLKELDHNRECWWSKPKLKTRIYKRPIRELYKLARLHGEINRTIQKFMELHDPSLLVIVVRGFIGIILGTYAMVVIPLRIIFLPTIDVYVYLLLQLVIYFFHFFYLVESAALFTRRAEKTGTILDDFSRKEANELLDTAIETISLELLHRDHKISNIGLYYIDFSLIYAVSWRKQ